MRFEHLTVGLTLWVVPEDDEPTPRKTKLNSRTRIVRNAMTECYADASIRSSSVSAPALSSGSFRLPHFGL